MLLLLYHSLNFLRNFWLSWEEFTEEPGASYQIDTFNYLDTSTEKTLRLKILKYRFVESVFFYLTYWFIWMQFLGLCLTREWDLYCAKAMSAWLWWYLVDSYKFILMHK